MKISGGHTEGGIVVGNTYDKYNSKNPVVQRIMSGFHDAVDACVGRVNPRAIYEIGCGEGYWVNKWNQQGIEARGSDFSEHAISIARENAKASALPADIFEVKSIYDMAPGVLQAYDLVVCCEVLEHLEHPRQGLEALARCSSGHFLLSVPREPVWCMLNLARGKYVSSLGNTPGHLQHWSKRGFRGLVSEYFDIVADASPFPWTMLLCRSR